jgi:deoxyribodipyrimidine photo-lyase
MRSFEPTLQAARARLSEVQPDKYARTRNALNGAVTGLSPYITHGFLSLREVYSTVHAQHPMDPKHKFVFELGWRAYYRHVWAHLGEGIHQSLHPGLLPDHAYQTEMPPDVLEARTGIAAIDLAIRELYTTGYVHNHARMWLASYLVHLRKVHWHTAAEWMIGHLLDGDVASNHLSWQWVAGTGSTKPYLFNADNVAKYAPMPWHSSGSVIDTSYESLEFLARNATAVNHRIDTGQTVSGLPQPVLSAIPPSESWSVPNPVSVAGRDVWLLHPWSIGAVPAGVGTNTLLVGVGLAECHAQMPWCANRWRFVTEGLSARTPQLWWGNVAQIAHALQGARSVGWQPEAHADVALKSLQAILKAGQPHPVIAVFEEPGLFEPVEQYSRSFSKWWQQTKITL